MCGCFGDQYLANLQNGAWCGFKYFSFDGSEQAISVRVRGSADGILKVFTDRSKPAVAEIRVSPSASWADFRASFRPEPGTRPLLFAYTGAGALDFSAFTAE